MMKSTHSLILFILLLVIVIFSPHEHSCLHPGQIVDISNWYLTLPIGNVGDPLDIFQPTLSNTTIPPFFISTLNDTAIQFRSTITNASVSTAGSHNPRCEMREMDPRNPNGLRAWWNNTNGVHVMEFEAAITHLPTRKASVVVGQIFSNGAYALIINLTNQKLSVYFKGEIIPFIKDYVLGTRYRMRFESFSGSTRVFYNDSMVFERGNVYYDTAYFKLGAYAGSNCSVEGELCGGEYAEAIVWNVTVSHDYKRNYPIGYGNSTSNNTNGTIINNGTVVNNGTIVNNGTVVNNGTIVNNGTSAVASVKVSVSASSSGIRLSIANSLFQNSFLWNHWLLLFILFSLLQYLNIFIK